MPCDSLVLTLPYDAVPRAPAVVDVYTSWCGPTAALVPFFKKMKTDIGDPLLMFSSMKSGASCAQHARAGLGERARAKHAAVGSARGRCQRAAIEADQRVCTSTHTNARPELDVGALGKELLAHAIAPGQHRVDVPRRGDGEARRPRSGSSGEDRFAEPLAGRRRLALAACSQSAAGRLDSAYAAWRLNNLGPVVHVDRRDVEPGVAHDVAGVGAAGCGDGAAGAVPPGGCC